MTNETKLDGYVIQEYNVFYRDEDLQDKLLFEVHPLRSKSDLEKYDAYLSKLPSNPFLKKELLHKDLDEEMGYFTLQNSYGTLLILLPFILRKIYVNKIESGYYDIISPYGLVGPIAHTFIKEQTLKEFWDQVDTWYYHHKVVSEFVRFNMDKNTLGYTGSIVAMPKIVCGKILPEKEQEKKFKRKVRNNVRKALKHKLEAKVYYGDIGIHEIKEYYEIFLKTMKRHNSVMKHWYSLDTFEKYVQNNPQCCVIVTVYLDKKAISSEFLLLLGNIIYSFLGGTDETYFYARPNEFLKITVLNWGRTHGFSYYYLGGGRDENEDLYRYKKAFFPKDEDWSLYTGRKILNKKKYKELVLSTHPLSKIDNSEYFPLYRLEPLMITN